MEPAVEAVSRADPVRVAIGSSSASRSGGQADSIAADAKRRPHRRCRRCQPAAEGDALVAAVAARHRGLGDGPAAHGGGRRDAALRPDRLRRSARSGPASSESPVGAGGAGGSVVVERPADLSRRPLHELAGQHPAAVARGRFARLARPDEFFVLGDNSPVSNDSRFWTRQPGRAGRDVPGQAVPGPPAGQVVPLKVFGRSVYWVPDPRGIRYIR